VGLKTPAAVAVELRLQFGGVGIEFQLSNTSKYRPTKLHKRGGKSTVMQGGDD
jgi:hypothetical protein